MEYKCNKCGAKFDLEIINSENEKHFVYKCIFCENTLIDISGNKDLIPKNIIKYPPVQITLPGIIWTVLNNYISPYKNMFDTFYFEKSLYKNGVENHICGVLEEGWNNLELYGEKKTEIGITGIRLRVFFLHECRQVQIPNIAIPYFLKHKGIGKTMISLIYNACKQFGYRLFIVDMVESFYEKLLKRGAIQIDLDSVEITDNTNLDIK